MGDRQRCMGSISGILTTTAGWVAVLFVSAVVAAESARAQTSPSLNPIQIENQRAGDASWKITKPAKRHEIEGYASTTSLNRGESIKLFVNTIDPSFTLDIYRMGWYGGAGARLMISIVLPGVRQSIPHPDPITGLVECRWTNPYVLQIPVSSDATLWLSGIYLAKLTGTQSGLQSYIPFVVRDDSRRSDLLLQHTVATDEAYNNWGGRSLYSQPRAYKVSFNRPFRSYYGAANFFRWGEYDMVRFVEREGYDVSYSSDLDTHEAGNLLRMHKALLVVGHDEYWSWQMRDNVEGARDQGLNLAFFSANDSYWQVRFEPSLITGDADRTMVCYKRAILDPYDRSRAKKHLVTVRFRNFPVNRPEDAMVGIMSGRKIRGHFDLVVTDASSWMFEGTGLKNGSHLAGLVAGEVDWLHHNSPPGIVRVGHSPFPYKHRTLYSDMTVYTTSAGSTVVATGAFTWSWGLDDFSYDPPHPDFANPAAQQTTRNILTRFGAIRH